MRLKRVMMMAIVGGLAGLLQTGAALAQQEDPIAPFVIDVRGAFMSSTRPAARLARPRRKALLPSNGIGLDVGAHVYPLRGRIVSLGVGASLPVHAQQEGAGGAGRRGAGSDGPDGADDASRALRRRCR